MELLTNIDEAEAARYLGCQVNPVPSDIKIRIAKASELIMNTAIPRYVYHIFTILPENGYELSGTNFSLMGNDIKKHLEGCHACVLMAATIGNEIDQLIRKTQITDMAQAVVLDTCASAAIENVCDNIEMEIMTALLKDNLYITNRFSPGYGDMPLALQKDFCQILDTSRKMGLSVSEGGIMTPFKSVTAVIGISHQKQQKHAGGCPTCSLQDTCAFKKGGQTCGK